MWRMWGGYSHLGDLEGNGILGGPSVLVLYGGYGRYIFHQAVKSKRDESSERIMLQVGTQLFKD
jgi:hypothetical protein